MKNSVIISFFLLLTFFTVKGQDSRATNNNEVQKYLDTFFKNIQNAQYDEAYLMFDEDLKKRESKDEFILYFQALNKYYGKIVNYENSFVGDYNTIRINAVYLLEFEKVQGSLVFRLIFNAAKELKLNHYHISLDSKSQIKIFDDMASAPLKLLVERDYKGLYNLSDTAYSEETFTDFQRSINELIINDTAQIRLTSHDIHVFGNSVNIWLSYAQDKQGEIIFEYVEKNGETELRDVRFYFRKKEENLRNKAFQTFMDTTTMYKDKETLTSIDSLKLEAKFEEIYYMQLTKTYEDEMQKPINPIISYREGYVIKVLNQFNSNDDNKQLGKDLLSYDFSSSLKVEYPDITQEDIKGITKQYFIQDNNDEVSYRLFLSGSALLRKDKIISFYEKAVTDKINDHVSKNEVFEKGLGNSKKYLTLIDKKKYESFWDKADEMLKKNLTKEEFVKTLKSIEADTGNKGKRKLHSKQYYQSFPGIDVTEIYLYNYVFENNKNIVEQISYRYINNELSIIGYRINPYNEK